MDTSCATHETTVGDTYFSTEKSTDDCPVVSGCGWRPQHNRTDDPLGADADRLATSKTGQEPIVTGLEITGEYKTDFILGEDLDLTGIVITASYSDNTTKVVDWKDENLKITGYQNTVKGEQTLTLSYNGANKDLTIRVLAPADSDPIRVSFMVLGDSHHGKDGQIHTLDMGDLPEVWAQADWYTVDANATVYDVMKEAAEKYDFKIYDRDTIYGLYVYAMEYQDTYLKEFANGENSGWMYTVNGEHSSITAAKKYLEDGDNIIFHYTDDYTLEDQAAANVVEVRDAILRIHAAEKLTLQDQAAVEAARKAYNALTEEEKSGISEALRKKLEAAEEKLAGLTHVHEWGSGTITTPATCTTAGVRTYTCKCGETKTEAIPAAGHQYGAWTTTTEATVFVPAVQTRTCSVCGTTETQNSGSALQATIKVNATTVPLKVKQKTSAFKVTGLANGDSVQSYKSSNTKIFTVTKRGVLKAGKKTGKATLTITLASGLQKKVTVKVQKKTVTTSKITGLQKKVTLKKGAKLAMKPSLTPITSTQKFTYSSSNKKIATVNKKGVITGKKAGKAKITVKSGKKKYTVTVTVTK